MMTRFRSLLPFLLFVTLTMPTVPSVVFGSAAAAPRVHPVLDGRSRPLAATFLSSATAAEAASPLDTARVGLYSGQTLGCTEVPGASPPTLDCSVRVGEAFVQTISGWAVISETATGLPVELEAEPGLPNATFHRLDDGVEVSEPPVGVGQVSGRYRFVPSEQETPAGDPLVVTFSATIPSGPGAGTSAAIVTRIHVVAGDRRYLVGGYKFEDANGSGGWDKGESGIAGWRVSLTGPNSYQAAAVTDSLGHFVFEVESPGTYVVAEESRAGWIATTPASVTLNLSGPADTWPTPVFGNRRSAGATVPSLSAEVSTDRGCLGSGDAAVYGIGETLQVSLRVQGTAAAYVVLRETLPGGASRELVARQLVAGGQWYKFSGTVDVPTGDRQFELSVYLPSNPTATPDATAACGYRVGSASAASAQVDPQSIDFGTVPVGQSGAGVVQITNVGQTTLVVSYVGVQGGGGSPFGIGGVPAHGFQLPPGASKQIQCTFAPQSPGIYQDWLSIQGNSAGKSHIQVGLRGQTGGAQQGLVGRVWTDRGCLERGQSPVYFVGDPIRILFRVDGQGMSHALATIEDIATSQQATTVFRQAVPVNQTYYFNGQVSPPTGYETMKLSAAYGAMVSEDRCTFLVAAGSAKIVGYKFHDDNGNGVWDGGIDGKGGKSGQKVPGAELPIMGWKILLSGPETKVTTTDATGKFEFDVTCPGNYVVSEEQLPGWTPSTASSVPLTLWMYPGEKAPEVVFGNKAGVPPPTSVLPSPFPSPSATSVATATPGPSPTPGKPCTDASQFSKLALGRSAAVAGDPGCYKIYVPDKWGGSLGIETTSGQLSLYRSDLGQSLAGPSAAVSHEVQQNGHGWYYVVVQGGIGGQLRNTFVQRGRSDAVPWNYWYFPYSPYVSGPHLYDQPGAYTAFDSRFGLGRQGYNYEYAYHRLTEAGGWWGHCWGGTLASIILEQPSAWGDFSQDELEGLAADFFDRTGAMALEWDWPFVIPSTSVGDRADSYADNFQNRLREYVRYKKVPLHMNLRQEAATGSEQVWNHAVYKYASVMSEEPMAVGDDVTEKVLQVRIVTTITANEDFVSGGVSVGDPETSVRREQEAEYTLVYSTSGEIVPNATWPTRQNWISMKLLAGGGATGTSLFIPSGISDVSPAAASFTGSTIPYGANPYVNSQRLGVLGLRKR